MIIEERLRKRQHEILSDYCKKCPDVCCNSQRHIVGIDSGSLSLFQEAGIPLLKQRELKKASLEDWKRHPSEKLFLKDGSEVQKPAIISWGNWLSGYAKGLYADMCPFYSRQNGCKVHEDPRRPLHCKDYPISIFPESDEPSGAYLDIKVMKTCPHREELISGLAKDFSIRVIQ